jgi:hypothetical protein
MKIENFIKCYEVLREELGNLCKWNCAIMDMENGKRKVTKAFLANEKAKYALAKEHFRGMCDMANITGEFIMSLSGQSGIDSEFGWYLE